MVLDEKDGDYVMEKVRYGSHGDLTDWEGQEEEEYYYGVYMDVTYRPTWEDYTHPVAYVNEGSHGMEGWNESFPSGPFSNTSGVTDMGYVAGWEDFEDQYTDVMEHVEDSDDGEISHLRVNGHSYLNRNWEDLGNNTQIEVPAQYYYEEAMWGLFTEHDIKTPWSEKPIWNDPTEDGY